MRGWRMRYDENEGYRSNPSECNNRTVKGIRENSSAMHIVEGESGSLTHSSLSPAQSSFAK